MSVGYCALRGIMVYYAPILRLSKEVVPAAGARDSGVRCLMVRPLAGRSMLPGSRNKQREKNK